MSENKDPLPRRRVTAREVTEWRRQVADEGSSVSEVAKRSGFQARTVRLALNRDDARQDLRSIQRERLRTAIFAHDAELLAEASRLRQKLGWPPAVSLVPGEEKSLAHKTHRALLMHMRRSAVPGEVKQWEELVRRYTRVVKTLEESLHAAVASGQALDSVGGVMRLMSIADTLAKGSPLISLGYSIKGGDLCNGATHIRSGVDSLDGSAARRAVSELERITTDLQDWDEFAELRSLHQQWEVLERKLAGAMDDIALRHLPRGRCSWCPGEP
jgi:hypothetical protein